MQGHRDKKVGKSLKENLEDKPIMVMIPTFNDWESLGLLLKSLEKVLLRKKLDVQVLVVNDGSYTSGREHFGCCDEYKAIRKVEVLELRRNLGHQRAIAIGLAYIEAEIPCQAVVVMDADGEDSPKYVPRLIHKCNDHAGERIIFAQRTRRSESLTFKIFYNVYVLLFRVLTGSKMRMGNFSIIPYKLLRRLVGTSEIWNHYTAGILKAKIDYAEIHTKRGVRLSGKSRMDFVSLVIHGLSAISVFGETVRVRMAVALFSFIICTVAAIVLILFIKTFTSLAIPGWASTVVLLLAVIF